MPALSFLNPAYLGALALAAIPVIIHLIRRRRVRVVPWAAWDFLLQSRRRNRRRLRIEQLLLLLLRIAIVCLVVLAFCRPLMRSFGAPLAGDARVHAIIVLDNSLSMGYRQGRATRFERARQVADDLLTRILKPGDSVSLVLQSSRPNAVIREPTYALSKAREQVRRALVSDLGTDYNAGAVLCAELLRKVKAPAREVYWITDNQASGFAASGAERARAAWRTIAAQARVTWINVAEGERDNLSAGAPLFSRELVTPQAPVRIESVIYNHGAAARRGLLVNLTVDGRAAGSARVDVPAHGKAKASFVYLFERAGAHWGTIQAAQPDGLARDDTAWFAVKVRDRLRVLVVNPRPAADPARDEAVYLMTALAPAGASEGGSTAIQPTLRTGARLAGLNLRAYDVVVVTGLVGATPADHHALEDFVRNGGGALLFPGIDTDASAVNRGLGDLMPARLGPRRSYPEGSELTLNPATITHPALLAFRDTSEVNLGSSRFSMAYELAPGARGTDPGAVLCRFSGGQPALVERRIGQGKVIVSASTAGSTGNTLPLHAAYVPLMHQLAAYLAAGPAAQRSLRLGEPFSTRFDVRDAGKPARLIDASGRASVRATTVGADGVTLAYGDTWRAGIYRVAMAGRGDVDAFAVNLPAAESDLSTASDRQVAAAVGPVRIQFAQATDSLGAVVRKARHGTEIWRSLVLAALPLLFLEGLLAQRFGRRG